MKDLLHQDSKKVKAALDRARQKGDQTWVKPLLVAFASRKDDALRDEMRELLSSLKVSAAESILVDALRDPEFAHISADILGFLWSCGFTCDGQLAFITEVACEGDYFQALEGSTLIEQVETATDEKDVLEALVVVGEALSDTSKSTIQPFAESIRTHLNMLSDGMM